MILRLSFVNFCKLLELLSNSKLKSNFETSWISQSIHLNLVPSHHQFGVSSMLQKFLSWNIFKNAVLFSFVSYKIHTNSFKYGPSIESRFFKEIFHL